MIGLFIGGLIGFTGYSAFKILGSRLRTAERKKDYIKIVKVADPTKQHLTSLDKLMELLGTNNDDRAMDLAGYVTFMAISKKEQSEKRIGLRKLVAEAISEIRLKPKYKKMINLCDESGKLNELADLITQYFICKNPLQKATLATVELKDVEDNLIYDSMLKSYKSVNLTAAKLIQKSSTKAVEKLVLEKKINDFLAEMTRDRGVKIDKKCVRSFFGKSDELKVWDYLKLNSGTIEQKYGIKIKKKSPKCKGEEGNHNFIEEFFYVKNDDRNPNRIYNGLVEVRKDFEMVIIKQGSVARLLIAPEAQEEHSKVREELIKNGTIVKTQRGYLFTKDHIVDKPSAASNLLTGQKTSGYRTLRGCNTNKLLEDYGI